jgi:hypothetical protein
MLMYDSLFIFIYFFFWSVFNKRCDPVSSLTAPVRRFFLIYIESDAPAQTSRTGVETIRLSSVVRSEKKNK